jgi:hypothetical protein
MVYLLDIQEPTDISLRVDGGGSKMTLAVESQCGTEDPQAPCVNCQPAVKRLRNVQPGQYFAVVESQTDSDFLLIAEALPLTLPIPVSGNDACADAVTIPSEGGVFSGNTAGMQDDYQPHCIGTVARAPDAAFKLELSESKHVQAALEATFDSLLFQFTDGGQGADCCNSTTADKCDDNGLYCSSSFLNQVLDPGTYYFVVDGYYSTSSGPYVLDLQITDP